MNANDKKVMRRTGSCHCGEVKFEVEADWSSAGRCNCTVCTKTGVTGGIVKPEAFKLLSDAAKLGMYEWGSKMSQRFFCKHCGVHCYGKGHLEELGGDFVSVNFNCLDQFDLARTSITYWDGRHDNWKPARAVAGRRRRRRPDPRRAGRRFTCPSTGQIWRPSRPAGLE